MKLALLFLLPLAAHAGFGDKIGNGGGLWACKRGDKIVKAQLVDLFEAERELLLKIPVSKEKDPLKAYRAKKTWIQKNLPALYGQLEDSFGYVEKNLKIVRANLEPIDDHGDFRSRPPAGECAGEWKYTQFANSNDSEEVLVQSDLWNNSAISVTDKAALLVHEAVYRYLRSTRAESDSNHTRKVTGFLFSDLAPNDMNLRIRSIITGDPNGGHDGTVDDSLGFSLRTKNEGAESLLHLADATYGQNVGTENFSSSCRIPPGLSGPQADLFCILEVEELDLYFGYTSLQVNVPSNACNYFRFTPYSFFTHQPGTGPTWVKHEVDYNGSIHDVLNSKNGTPVCPYNYSEEGGPNCCTGTFTHEIVTYASDGSQFTTTTQNSWGGSTANCVSGPGMLPELQGAPGQLPRAQMYYVTGTGINSTLSLPPPVNGAGRGPPYSSNVFTGNFYNPRDHHTGRPVAMLPAGGFKPQDTYQFECLDAGGSMKARIRLMIREWNTYPIQQGRNPDADGMGPGDLPINDRFDWKDFGDAFPGANL